MPGGDGMGPLGGGRGRGRGFRRRGPSSSGPGGYCICPACGEKIPHQPGIPCSSLSCPKCGGRMLRE